MQEIKIFTIICMLNATHLERGIKLTLNDADIDAIDTQKGLRGACQECRHGNKSVPPDCEHRRMSLKKISITWYF